MLNIFLVNTILILFGITLLVTGIRNNIQLFPILTGVLFLYLSLISISQNISKRTQNIKLKKILSSQKLNTFHFLNLILIVITIIFISIKNF